MKKILFLALIVMFLNTGIFTKELTGIDIINEVNKLMNQETIYSKSKMTIMTSSGKTRTFEMESWSRDQGEKNLIRYLAPRRVKGQATLMLNHADDIWVFFPRTQRVRKLATHAKKQKMEGSDFSYEDMGSGDSFIKDFSASRLKDEKVEGFKCFKLELKRNKGSNISYSRLVMWVIKENFVPVVIDYYDEKDADMLLKRLVQSEIKTIDGIATATKMVMYNKQDNTSTAMEMTEVKYNIKLKESMFTERGLKK